MLLVLPCLAGQLVVNANLSALFPNVVLSDPIQILRQDLDAKAAASRYFS